MIRGATVAGDLAVSGGGAAGPASAGGAARAGSEDPASSGEAGVRRRVLPVRQGREYRPALLRSYEKSGCVRVWEDGDATDAPAIVGRGG
jgi:hypothetical protein